MRGLDRVESPDLPDHLVGNITERATVDRALAGMDTVIHLAAMPDEAPFVENLVPNNVIGLYHVFEACADAGVRRLVFTSSVHVVNALIPPDHMLRPEDGTAVTNHYGLFKLWGEQYGEMLSRERDLSFIGVRLAWYLPRPPSEKIISAAKSGRLAYISHDDAGRFLICAVEAEAVDFSILYATSHMSGDPWYDPQPARDTIGYEAVDTFPEGLYFTGDHAT